RWQCAAPGVGPVRFQDPCWPDAAEFGGRLVVSASVADHATGPYPGPQLWWLQLDPGRGTILAADRMIQNDGDRDAGSGGSPPEEQRRPCVGRDGDGRLLLAYLGRADGQSTWDLWVAPITHDETTGSPRVVHSARRKVAEGCVGLALAF